MNKNKMVALALCTMGLMNLNAQTVKNYSGPYTMANDHLRGEASYAYLDGEDGERIKNGKFSFKTEGYQENASVDGVYKDGVKEGKWTTKTTRGKSYIRPPKPQDNIGALKGEGISTMSGNYVNGKREGQWMFSGGKPVDGISKSALKSVANFFEGVLDGAFSYSLDDPDGNHGLYSISLTGVFTKGMMDGKWVLKYKNHNKIELVRTLVFKDGKLISAKLVDTSTGSIAAKDSDAERYTKKMFDESQSDPKYATTTLYFYFYDHSEPIQGAFLPWIGDPTLEKYDHFYNMGMNSPGFVKIPE